jgi:hypothetical protein
MGHKPERRMPKQEHPSWIVMKDEKVITFVRSIILKYAKETQLVGSLVRHDKEEETVEFKVKKLHTDKNGTLYIEIR